MSSSVSPNNNSPSLTPAIPIKSQAQQQQASSSFFDKFSTSSSNRTIPNEPPNRPTQPKDFSVPPAAPTKKLWVSDDKVSICMCCKETRFSMVTRRHHCRRCGRVVCNPCSQYLTTIKNRPERTCKDCYQHLRSSQVTTPTTPRPEPTVTPAKKFDSFRP